MRSILILLIVLSLAGNAVLLAGWLARRGVDAVGRTPPVSGGVASADSAAPADATDPTGAISVDRSVGSWQLMESTDLHVLSANLRSAGMSEDQVAAAIRAVVAQRLEPRRAALMRRAGERPYWKWSSSDGLDVADRAELRAIAREEDEAVRAIVGAAAMPLMMRYYLAQRYGRLPPDKASALVQIDSDYNDLSSQIMRERGDGPMMPWDAEKLTYLEAERRKDIEAVLTPEEQETLRLYGSDVATGMRIQLAGFHPTEQEFRALLDIRTAMEEESRSTMFGGHEAAQLSAARSAASKEQIRAVLGDARYADYERVTDSGFRTARTITLRLNLPEENATAAYNLSRDVQARIKQLDANASMSPADRRAAYAALATEARGRLDTLLTAAGTHAFTRSGGSWLRNLERRGGAR